MLCRKICGDRVWHRVRGAHARSPIIVGVEFLPHLLYVTPKKVADYPAKDLAESWAG